jgi:glyoxylase-like metal-dependent hydrolase (beta-lactamase superfamily II)
LYTQELMLRGAVDGVATDVGAARTSLGRIRAYAERTATVYLPSHEPESARRLEEREVVGRPGPSAAALGAPT